MARRLPMVNLVERSTADVPDRGAELQQEFVEVPGGRMRDLPGDTPTPFQSSVPGLADVPGAVRLIDCLEPSISLFEFLVEVRNRWLAVGLHDTASAAPFLACIASSRRRSHSAYAFSRSARDRLRALSTAWPTLIRFWP